MPNTSVSPEAMVKIIIPIASPAAVSVTKVENEPMKGAASERDEERRRALAGSPLSAAAAPGRRRAQAH